MTPEELFIPGSDPIRFAMMPQPTRELVLFITLDLDDTLVTFPPSQIQRIEVSDTEARLVLDDGSIYSYGAPYAGDPSKGYQAIKDLQSRLIKGSEIAL